MGDTPLKLGVSFTKRLKATKNLANKLCSVVLHHVVGYFTRNNPMASEIDAMCAAVI